MKKKYLFSILIFWQIIGYAQNKVLERNENQIPVKVNYYDKSGKKNNTFDLLSNNPYNKLNYPIKGEINGVKIYDISKEKENNLDLLISKKYIPTTSSFLREAKNSNEDSMILQTITSTINMSYDSDSSKYSIVSYNLILSSQRRVESMKSSIFVLDSIGEIIKKIDNIDNESIYPLINDEGTHIFVKYGGQTDCNSQSIKLPDSYKIIDAHTGETIIDEAFNNANTYLKSKCSYLESDLAPSVIGSLFILYSYSNTSNKFFLRIYDLKNKKLYAKELDFLPWNKEILPDRIEYLGKKFYYDKDFEVYMLNK